MTRMTPERGTIDLSRAIWRKSARSGGNGDCVEVATNVPGVVAVRDSKAPDGPKLSVTPSAWHQFTRSLRTHSHESR